MKQEIIKLLEDYTEEKLLNMGLGNDFLFFKDHTKSSGHKSQSQWDLLKLKSFCAAKEINKMKCGQQNGKSTCQPFI